jgi:hypothetical protein
MVLIRPDRSTALHHLVQMENKLRVQRAGIALGEFRKDVLHELFIF